MTVRHNEPFRIMSPSCAFLLLWKRQIPAQVWSHVRLETGRDSAFDLACPPVRPDRASLREGRLNGNVLSELCRVLTES